MSTSHKQPCENKAACENKQQGENKAADEKGASLAKYSRKVLTSIPSTISPESIKLTKLPDGYKLSASYNESKKDERGSIESSLMYQTEERYGVKVKDVKGGFNSEGVYEVNIDFESE